MNTVHDHEEYRPQSESPAAPPAQEQQEQEPPKRLAPTFPAETRRRKGYPYKSPVLASILSLFPGLGQIYIGYYQRGFAHVALIAIAITALSSGLGGLTPMVALMLAFFWIYNIIDAGQRATLYNQAVDGIEGIEMPKDMKMPKGGSTAWGVVIMAFSIILLLNLRFDVSMAWIEDWWPVAGILLGGYLIYKSRKNGGD